MGKPKEKHHYLRHVVASLLQRQEWIREARRLVEAEDSSGAIEFVGTISKAALDRNDTEHEQPYKE